MANNKVYANFLMHGRTKGSRNGVSTTKGYTAVGKKATGKLINGRYVYDYYTPYGTKTPTLTNGYTPLAAISTTEQKRQEQLAKDNYKARQDKMKAENAARIKAENAAKAKTAGYKQMAKQQAAAEQAGINRANAINKGSKNNWTQQANLARTNQENYKKLLSGERSAAILKDDTFNEKYEGSPYSGKYHNTYNESHLSDFGPRHIDAYPQGDKQSRAAIKNGKPNNWQQQAAYQQQKDAERNKARASAAKGAANDWQSKANTARAITEYGRNATAARKAKEAARSASYNKMSSTQKNAMQGDPRYTSNKPGPLNTSRDPKYGYSGKNDSRAPVFKEITMIDMYGNKTGGKETPMNRDPYFESWAKATNKQETAKAQAGNKAFMNAFEESKKRNSRSDIGNAVADFKEEAKAKAKSLFKKKKKK